VRREEGGGRRREDGGGSNGQQDCQWSVSTVFNEVRGYGHVACFVAWV
jgi:hypothetical protein